MDIDIKVPSLGESETEATLVSWVKQQGDTVAVDDVIAEIESDKITMEITAVEPGLMKETFKQTDSTVIPGEVIGVIDTSVAPPKKHGSMKASATQEPVVKTSDVKEPAVKMPARSSSSSDTKNHPVISGRKSTGDTRLEKRQPMSGLRKRIAARLKEAQNTAAMLTTFNEVNMQSIMDLRQQHKEGFQQKHQVGLGFMSFFIKACVFAASKYPALNAYIEQDEIVYHNYMDIGIAVSTEKGLVVPTLRNADSMSFAEIEAAIIDLAIKAREGGLMPDDLKGGTFSITNGGVFGSMLSTPILNPPQSAILGMHTIQRRPIAEGDQVVIRPMMYLALTYDHRLIDGRDAVQFLVTVKSYLENPGMALLDL